MTMRDKHAAYCWLCGARVYGAVEIYCRECRQQEEGAAPTPKRSRAKPKQGAFPAWPERQMKLFE